MANTNGGAGDSLQKPEPYVVDAAKQAVHDAMMEELGIGRRDALPLADKGWKVDATLVPISLPKSSNPWANATFDDFDPASELDDIAGGQLYRMRRGSEYDQTQPVTRGGHHRGRRDANTVAAHQRAQASSRGDGHGGRGGRGGRGRGGYNNMQNDRARGNIGSRHEAAITMLRNTRSDVHPAPTRGQGVSRGDRGGSRGASQGNRQRRPVPQQSTPTMHLSTDRFMASVAAQARLPTTVTPTVSSGHSGSRFADSPKKQRTPPHLQGLPPTTLPTPAKASVGSFSPTKSGGGAQEDGLSNSRWNPSPVPLTTSSRELRPALLSLNVLQDISNVYNGSGKASQKSSPSVDQQSPPNDILAEMHGVRLRLVGEISSELAIFRLCRDIGTSHNRMQCMKAKDIKVNLMAINDIMTDMTTLFINPDCLTNLTYCSHRTIGSEVWEIIFGLPHEAAKFLSTMLPRGPQNRLLSSAKTNENDGPKTEAKLDRLDDLVDTVCSVNSENEDLGEKTSVEPVRSAMMDMAFLGANIAGPILDSLNKPELGLPFLNRVLALVSDFDEYRTDTEIYDSEEVADAAEVVIRQFFENSPLWAIFNEVEQDEYVRHLGPPILELAVKAREHADTSVKEPADVSKTTTYTTDQMLELRNDGAPLPSFKFTPTAMMQPNGTSGEVKFKLGKLPSVKVHAPTNSDVDRLGLAFGKLAVNGTSMIKKEPISDMTTLKVNTDLGLHDLAENPEAVDVTSLESVMSESKSDSGESIKYEFATISPAPSGIQEVKIVFQEPKSAEIIAEMEVRKKIGLANLSKSIFADGPSSFVAPAPPPPARYDPDAYHGPPRAPHTSFIPKVEPLTKGPTSNVAPVVIKEKLSYLELAELEARKKRGANVLSNSRFASPLVPSRGTPLPMPARNHSPGDEQQPLETGATTPGTASETGSTTVMVNGQLIQVNVPLGMILAIERGDFTGFA